MAAKNAKEDARFEDKQKALDAALSQIEKQFGKGAVMKLGDNNAQMQVEVVPSGSLSLDLALGVGGVTEEAKLRELEEGISLKPGENKASMNYYPDLEYYVNFTKGEAEISDDRIFYGDGKTRNALLLTGKVEDCFN